MDKILGYIKEYYDFALALVGAFAILATITANKTDNKIINFLLKLINAIGMNIGKAKNDPNEV